MPNSKSEKYFDVRAVDFYLKKGVISRDEIDKYHKALPNDEENFELTVLQEDDDMNMVGFSEDDIKSMPPLSEDDIDNFDFLNDKSST